MGDGRVRRVALVLTASNGSGWWALPAAIAVAAPLAWLAARLGRTGIGTAITLATALLLPGIALVLAPGLWPGWQPGLLPGLLPALLFAARMLGPVPLLLLPVLHVLARMPPGQARAASGLGAGPAARLRLLWLPQLAPACLLGLVLAIMLAGAANVFQAHAVQLQALLSSPRPGP